MILRAIFIVILLSMSICSYGRYTFYGNDIQLDHSISKVTKQDSLKVVYTENRLVIENLQKDNVLEIYNIMGVKVFTRRLKSGTNEYQISLPKGYYIIKIGEFTKKIAIK
jgi:hypothetical protein